MNKNVSNHNNNASKKAEKIYDIRERIFQYALRIIEISEMLPQTKDLDAIRKQFIKSGTSIGANMEESDGTDTRRDFVNKVVLTRKEAKVSKYWLRIIASKYIKKDVLEDDIQEVQEIINILSAIINKTKSA
ncbi:MAG: four helix bundle protein [Thermoplasmata archaeon]|nr:MAG: four helix bundle protein [Thermoplasmata archaeon]